jgi:site-specific recombinase XerD
MRKELFMLQQIDLTTLPVAPTIHWMEAFAAWLHSTPTQKHRERSRLTLSAYLYDVNSFNNYFEQVNGQAFSPELLNSEDLRNYFKSLEENAKPATYNRKLASMRMLIGWARNEGLIGYDPAEWIPFMDATRKSPRDVSPEERLKLEAAAEAGEDSLIGLRDSLIFFLMDDAGLRVNEVVTLKLSDLHLDDGYIHVLGKGKKQREPKIGSRLANKIRTWLDRGPESIDGTLITDESGHHILRGQAWRRFGLVAEHADIHATPHVMRHTYVLRYMDAYMKGDPWKLPAAIDAVCQQTGDKPEVILAYYTRARESDMRAAVEAM